MVVGLGDNIELFGFRRGRKDQPAHTHRDDFVVFPVIDEDRCDLA
jgi:hypothetical protein